MLLPTAGMILHCNAGGYVKCIVSLGWCIWTCNSKAMQVYADQGSLLGTQEEAADLAQRLAAAEEREAAVKAALSAEQASRQAENQQAAVRDVEAAAAAKHAEAQVQCCFLHLQANPKQIA